jgi:ELWxxDGT repeat protein
MVMDINPGASSSSPNGLTRFGDRIFFAANTAAQGTELWSTDGNTTAIVQNIAAGNASSYPGGFTPFGNHLYFSATGPAGTEIWKTDGTTTNQVADINPGATGSGPSGYEVFRNHLYFRANDGVSGAELWRTDGTTTSSVTDINPTGSSDISAITTVGPNLYFSAEDGTNGDEPWAFDGTAPRMLADIWEGKDGSTPDDFIELGGHVYFQAYSEALGDEIWGTDGSTVELVKDLLPGPDGSDAYDIVRIGDSVYFSGDDGIHGGEIFKIAPPDRTVTVTIAGWRVRLNAKGAGRVKLTCPLAEESGPCAGKLSLRTRKKVRVARKRPRRKLILAGTEFSIEAGRSKTVTLKVKPANRRILRRVKAARDAVAIANVSDQAGNRRRVTRRLKTVP